MTGQLQIPAVLEGLVNPAAGERAKQTGMTEADEHADTTWKEACDNAIRIMAARGIVFQAADLIAEGLVDEPEHPNAWGSRFQKAAHAGTIRFAGHAPSKRATVHKSICKQWVGVRAGAEEAA